MGLPNILIEFKAKASTAIKRGERGIVAVMVIDKPIEVTKIFSITDIPEGLTQANKDYISRAFLGGVNPIKSLVIIVTNNVAEGLKTAETVKFDYIALPPNISAVEATTAATFIKTLRDNKNIKVKAVLPNTKADHEGIINFTTNDIKTQEKTFTAAEYCSRIAGLLAGTPLQQSSAYYVLPEVQDVPKFTKTELDTKIDEGEFVIFHDGEKVKVARGVNSLTTVNVNKSEDYKVIKIVDTMDLIYKDIKNTCEDNYIGKFPNNYDNKCNLVVSITAYLEGLRDDNILDQKITTGINIKAQKAYLKARGEDVDNMDDKQIKEANTQNYVFIESAYKILNAIEDIAVQFYI
ncbi:MAG: phage tail sheath subtilisin-like domain-containing protein [Oscillospiraceae bacterium]